MMTSYPSNWDGYDVRYQALLKFVLAIHPILKSNSTTMTYWNGAASIRKSKNMLHIEHEKLTYTNRNPIAYWVQALNKIKLD
ncbi:MAG: hypothetical protein EBS82_02825 [Methylocystaceae bacterium]|nr:hypothetical protein [Methylocystaceae bacterium]